MLEILKSTFTGFLLTLLTGVCFHCLLESVLLSILNFPLRKNAWGFHAKTKIRCILLSAVVLLATLGGLVRIIWPKIVYIGIALVSFAFILYLAPVENPNKRLDKLDVCGKVILQPHGKEFFTWYSKHLFTLHGKHFFT